MTDDTDWVEVGELIEDRAARHHGVKEAGADVRIRGFRGAVGRGLLGLGG